MRTFHHGVAPWLPELNGPADPTHRALIMTLLDVALYLPKRWSEDPARRAEAGVPDTVGFATKPQLARRLIETAVAGGLPCRWVAGDEAYGGDPQWLPHYAATDSATSSRSPVRIGRRLVSALRGRTR